MYWEGGIACHCPKTACSVSCFVPLALGLWGQRAAGRGAGEWLRVVCDENKVCACLMDLGTATLVSDSLCSSCLLQVFLLNGEPQQQVHALDQLQREQEEHGVRIQLG